MHVVYLLFSANVTPGEEALVSRHFDLFLCERIVCCYKTLIVHAFPPMGKVEWWFWVQPHGAGIRFVQPMLRIFSTIICPLIFILLTFSPSFLSLSIPWKSRYLHPLTKDYAYWLNGAWLSKFHPQHPYTSAEN